MRHRGDRYHASAVWLTGLYLMTVADIGPVLWFMERLKFLDYQNCPLKERQFHDTSFSGEDLLHTLLTDCDGL